MNDALEKFVIAALVCVAVFAAAGVGSYITGRSVSHQIHQEAVRRGYGYYVTNTITGEYEFEWNERSSGNDLIQP